MTDDLWIRSHHPAPGAGVRLACFPHAGGAAGYGFPLSAALTPGIEVLSVQYPGRHDRLREQPFTDLHLLADHVADALSPWTDRPYALLGHSYGAVVAYEVARRLGQDGTTRAPLALFASGRRAPSTHRDERLHLAPDHRLVAELRALNGTANPALDDEEILAMALPALRADYQAVETYIHHPGPRLDIPVTALVGDADPKVTLAEAGQWSDHTTAGFLLEVFGGGHFYLADHQEAVIRILRDRLNAHVR
jgi:surfactin synthase thioesterase subunit